MGDQIFHHGIVGTGAHAARRQGIIGHQLREIFLRQSGAFAQIMQGVQVVGVQLQHHRRHLVGRQIIHTALRQAVDDRAVQAQFAQHQLFCDMQGQALHGLQKLLGILAHGLCSGFQCVDQCLIHLRLGLGAGLHLQLKFCAYLFIQLCAGIFHAIGETLGAGFIDCLLRVARCQLRHRIFLSISAAMELAALRIGRIGLRQGDTF